MECVIPTSALASAIPSPGAGDGCLDGFGEGEGHACDAPDGPLPERVQAQIAAGIQAALEASVAEDASCVAWRSGRSTSLDEQHFSNRQLKHARPTCKWCQK